MEPAPNIPFYVRRTRTNNLPVYVRQLGGGTKYVTTVKHVQGDLKELERLVSSF